MLTDISALHAEKRKNPVVHRAKSKTIFYTMDISMTIGANEGRNIIYITLINTGIKSFILINFLAYLFLYRIIFNNFIEPRSVYLFLPFLSSVLFIKKKKKDFHEHKIFTSKRWLKESLNFISIPLYVPVQLVRLGKCCFHLENHLHKLNSIYGWSSSTTPNNPVI